MASGVLANAAVGGSIDLRQATAEEAGGGSGRYNRP